jgi:alkanesulfonate monooxygenase SsuD/methylene tetrahydromethanopterin reductase-like flavin-dependent oxidoreductase (luciferase family)
VVTVATRWGFAVNNFYEGRQQEVDEILGLGAKVEEAGFDSLWLGDHVLWHTPIIDALSILAAFTVTTKRITLGTAILLLGLRQPGVAAKTITSLNVMSGGRLELGLGVGGENPKEFAFAGVEHERRGAVLDEALRVLTQQWDDDSDAQKVSPVGPPVPILIGGRSKAARRRIERFDAGWLASFVSPRRIAEERELLNEQAGKEVPIYLNVYLVTDPDGDAAVEKAGRFLATVYAMGAEPLMRYTVAGTPDQCAEQLAGFAEAGVSHFVLRPAAWDQQAQCEQWADDLLPALRSIS